MTLELQMKWARRVLALQAQGQWVKASFVAIGFNHLRRNSPCLYLARH